MDKSVVTLNGQVVIPCKLRRRFGIKKRTQVYFYERDAELVREKRHGKGRSK
jgi:AbrB family looped-hinge helix DNA binding protein